MTGGTAVPEEDKSLPTSSDTSGGAGEADTSHTARPRRHDRRSAAAKAGSVEGSAGAGVSPRGGPGEESDGEAEPEPGESAEKKARFMWTPEMHQRFEVAVHKLGVAQAKPQTIRQLMACEGEEDAPTRQNIKSHLQKYRQHRQTSLPTIAAARLASSAAPPSPAATEEARSRFELYQLNLLQQLELQANLHDQLLCQRRDQEALGCQLSHSASSSMHPNQLMRMAQHVVFQRHLLQHLFELLQAHTEDVMRDGTRMVASMATVHRPDCFQPSPHGGGDSQSQADSGWAFPPLAGMGASAAGMYGLCSPLWHMDASPDVSLDVPEVPSQADVFSGFECMDTAMG